MSDMKPIVEFLPKGQQIEVIMFEAFVKPRGALDWQVEAHALMFYYLNARRIYEMYEVEEVIIYEGDDDPRTNYIQLFESIASLYGVDANKMTTFWPMIDEQCFIMGFPLLPKDQKYRYTGRIVLLDS